MVMGQIGAEVTGQIGARGTVGRASMGLEGGTTTAEMAAVAAVVVLAAATDETAAITGVVVEAAAADMSSRTAAVVVADMMVSIFESCWLFLFIFALSFSELGLCNNHSAP